MIPIKALKIKVETVMKIIEYKGNTEMTSFLWSWKQKMP
ncbi:hypothetical protein HMPREF9964_2036 [Streptococcus dysgalactiae subsp. equisimilis SK1249]|nr:hypothetical protein HMPREF9964_2036 [Streptococcus dysgalactiae subsp. equisimilis SK1249]